jgi:large conductance mechanosensitive channel
MKKFLSEFKAFALKGNVLDMAVGVIIATAFTGIVKSLTENFINPILQFVTVGKRYSLLEIRVLFSNFATEVVNFIITAFVLFCLVKVINKLMTFRKKEEVKAPVTKVCPFCKSEINIEATRCPNCTSELE